MNLALQFKLERETKNTWRFHEVVKPKTDPVIGPLYIQKSALPCADDKTTLVVTITSSNGTKETPK